MFLVHGIPVYGVQVDPLTGCAHYRSRLDLVAIKFKCCGLYYACHECHAAGAGHPVRTWPRTEWDQRAVLCGACGTELTIEQYLNCGAVCPGCGAGFNPRCRLHDGMYFDAE